MQLILQFSELNTDNTNDNLPAVNVNLDDDGNNVINYPYLIERATIASNDVISPSYTEIQIEFSDMIEIFKSAKYWSYYNFKPRWTSKFRRFYLYRQLYYR